jgi:hypothetical protein
MKWLTISEIAKKSGVPERTLRLYASQGKIKSKKAGKFWMCELASLKNAGIEIADQSADLPKVADKVAAESGKDSAKKYRTLDDLGVFRDLVELWKNDASKNAEEVHESLQLAMEQIAMGFYEYHSERKMIFFRNAREGVVRAIVGVKLNAKKENKSLSDQLENKIIPGLIGLIKRYDRSKK